MAKLSPRLTSLVDALPLRPGIRVLEIGCGPGAAAREIARRVGDGHVLAIDRSARAIAQAQASCAAEIRAGRLSLRCVAIEDFELEPGEEPFDLAFAARVGALDGRHRELEEQALRRIARALRADGRLFIDGGDPLREIRLRRRSVRDCCATRKWFTLSSGQYCPRPRRYPRWADGQCTRNDVARPGYAGTTQGHQRAGHVTGSAAYPGSPAL